MEAQAQWAGKLLQEYQRRAEACGFPGPYAEGPHPAKDSSAKSAKGTTTELFQTFLLFISDQCKIKAADRKKSFYLVSVL